MSISTSHRPPANARQHPAGGGGGRSGGDDEGGGGGGGGDGDLVKVAFARNEVEGEMLQGLLSEVGIPSVLKRSLGFDNPDFLSSGPRDLMVNRNDAKRAREVLADVMIEDERDEVAELEGERRLARGESPGPSPAQLAFWLIAVAVAGFLLLWLLTQVN
jgi:hypothetical protein